MNGPETVEEPPAHPIGQMTSSELGAYRRDLEHAVRRLPEHATYLPVLRDRLDDVLAELAARERLAAANRRP